MGDYRPEHLFTLRQALASFRHYQRLVAECDQEVQALLDRFPATVEAAAAPLPPDPRPRPRRFAPQVELRTELYRILGVDLTQVPGFATLPLALFAELGPTLAALNEGRVWKFVYLKGLVLEGGFCAACNMLYDPADEACPLCQK